MVLFNPIEKFRRLKEQSKCFPVSVPLRSNRIEEIGQYSWARQAVIGVHASNACVVLHARVGALIDDFLLVKRLFGTPNEKEIYSHLDRDSFIKRLFTKRAIAFSGQYDNDSIKRDGQRVRKRRRADEVETPYELPLGEYLSYDEMQIAALLGTSSPTFFINSAAQFDARTRSRSLAVQRKGGIVGLTGPRFDLRGFFDYPHMIVDASCTVENGYRPGSTDILDKLSNAELDEPKRKKAKTCNEEEDCAKNERRLLLLIWAKFYNDSNSHFPTYAEVLAHKGSLRDENFVPLPMLSARNALPGNQMVFLNVPIFKKRMRILAETLLLEANNIGEKKQKLVFLRITPFALDKFRVTRKQYDWMFSEWLEAAKLMNLTKIGVLSFSRFPPATMAALYGRNAVYNRISGNKIVVEVTNRKLTEISDTLDTEYVLVSSFQNTVNSFPGFEHWTGKATHSLDCEAAFTTTIPQLLNPMINNFYEKIRVLS